MGAIHHYFRGQPKKDQNWGDYMADTLVSQTANGFPIVRDIADTLVSGKERAGPISLLYESGLVLKDVRDWAEGRPVSKEWPTHAMTALGVLPGSPLGGKITKSEARAVQFLWDASRGKYAPQTWDEWVNGLTKGRPHGKHGEY